MEQLYLWLCPGATERVRLGLEFGSCQHPAVCASSLTHGWNLAFPASFDDFVATAA